MLQTSLSVRLCTCTRKMLPFVVMKQTATSSCAHVQPVRKASAALQHPRSMCLKATDVHLLAAALLCLLESSLCSYVTDVLCYLTGTTVTIHAAVCRNHNHMLHLQNSMQCCSKIYHLLSGGVVKYLLHVCCHRTCHSWCAAHIDGHRNLGMVTWQGMRAKQCKVMLQEEDCCRLSMMHSA